MPSIRVGFSTDLNITGGLTGIGTINPAARLDVVGQISVEDIAGSGGVSTFREYQGFSQVQAKITNNTLIDNGSSGPFSSLSGEIRITGETTVSSGSTVEVGKTKTLTVTDKFAVPLGDTNSRDNTPEAGTTRFNQDFGTLEFFDGNNWKTVNSYARGNAAGRGLFGGGESPVVANIDLINIQSQGNATNFGDLSVARRIMGGFSSNIRGLWGGGSTPSNSDVIDYVTIASEGNAIDFGNITTATDQTAACSSSTRGLVGGGEGPSTTNVISYVEISTTGNSLDFGDLSEPKRGHSGMASATRGFFCGGNNPGSTTVIDFVTIASLGNAIKFGDRIEDIGGTVSASNSTRGIIFDSGRISFVTLASQGNAVYFGFLTTGSGRGSAVASQTRVVTAIGTDGVTDPVNNIEYVTIATSGNALDFGDLTVARKSSGACSDSHGGLGGF
jgi:hypothetical protein